MKTHKINADIRKIQLLLKELQDCFNREIEINEIRSAFGWNNTHALDIQKIIIKRRIMNEIHFN